MDSGRAQRINMKYELLELNLNSPTIRVMGFGAAGNSAVNYMVDSNLKLGRLNSVTDPEISDTDLLFLTAAMTESDALNELIQAAKIARKRNILTIALATSAMDSILSEIKGSVDSFIIFPESMGASFNELCLDAVQEIIGFISQEGLINLDFSDLKGVITKAGRCAIGSGISSGDNKAQKAIEMSFSSALLKGVNLQGADGILIKISSACLGVDEFDDILSPINKLASDAAIIKVATVINEKLTDMVKVSILCTGIG